MEAHDAAKERLKFVRGHLNLATHHTGEVDASAHEAIKKGLADLQITLSKASGGDGLALATPKTAVKATLSSAEQDGRLEAVLASVQRACKKLKIGYVGTPALLKNELICNKLRSVILTLVRDFDVVVGVPNSLLAENTGAQISDLAVAPANTFDVVLVAPGGPGAQAEASKFADCASLVYFCNSEDAKFGRPEWLIGMAGSQDLVDLPTMDVEDVCARVAKAAADDNYRNEIEKVNRRCREMETQHVRALQEMEAMYAKKLEESEALRRNLEAKCSELDERTAQLLDLFAQQQEQSNGHVSASTLQDDVLVQRLAESQAAVEAALAAKELAEAERSGNEEGYLKRIALLNQEIANLSNRPADSKLEEREFHYARQLEEHAQKSAQLVEQTMQQQMQIDALQRQLAQQVEPPTTALSEAQAIIDDELQKRAVLENELQTLQGQVAHWQQQANDIGCARDTAEAALQKAKAELEVLQEQARERVNVATPPDIQSYMMPKTGAIRRQPVALSSSARLAAGLPAAATVKGYSKAVPVDRRYAVETRYAVKASASGSPKEPVAEAPPRSTVPNAPMTSIRPGMSSAVTRPVSLRARP